MKTRPGISDEEIQSMMDFNKVLDVHRNAQKKGKFIVGAGLAGGAIVIALIAWQFMNTPAQPQPDQNQPDQKQAEQLVQKPQQEILQDSSAAVEPSEPVTIKPRKKFDRVKKGPKQETKEPVATGPAYTEAEPVNGYPDLYAWFQKELKYPVGAEKDSIEGIVSVSFVINKDGKPEQIKILNTLGKLFDDEVVRVITNMPEWKPASLNGNPVPARISMPLTFQINRTQKQ